MSAHYHDDSGFESVTASEAGPGTKDGFGAGDHDRPNTPRKPRTLSPFPFTTVLINF